MTGLRIAERPPLAPAVWQADAACRGMDLDVFYSLTDDGPAKAICSRCTVVSECRDATDRAEDGVPRKFLFGVFAGETPLERWRRRSGGPSTAAPDAESAPLRGPYT